MILLFIHSLTHTTFQLLEHTLYNHTTFGCKAYVIIISFAYYIGKSCLLCFYIIRADESFKGSPLEYSTRTVIVYIVIVNIFGVISAVGWPIFQLPFTKSVNDNNAGHYYCIISAAVEDNYEYHTALTYFLIYATIIEIILSIWTVWLFIGKLVTFSHNSYLVKRKSFYNDSAFMQRSDVQTVPDLEDLDSNKTQHVQIWHKQTKQFNKMLLSITKLFLLLIISVITSQVAVILYLTVFSRVYAIDSCINVYCMYLSFYFAERIWKTLFCGQQCISCSFPLIKMWTFTASKISCCFKKVDSSLDHFKKVDTIDEDEDEDEDEDDNDNEETHSVNVVEKDNNCKHCECVCSVYDADQRNMHKIIKEEYNLFILNKG